MKKYLAYFFVIMSITAFGWKYYTGTPGYAVMKIRTSLDDKDKTSFYKYVDIDSTADLIINDLVKFKLIPGFKGQIKQIVDMQIKHHFSPAIVRKRIGASSYDKIKDSIQYVDSKRQRCDDSICIMMISFNDRKRAKQISIKAKLSKTSGNWKLVELPGFTEIMIQHLELSLNKNQ